MDIRIGNIISFFVRFFYDVYVKIQFNSPYLLEKKCLLKIKNNFKCYCKEKKNHFPVILYFNDFFNLIITNFVGNCCKNLKNKALIDNYEEQIDCIVKNLKNININQNDVVAKNVCINKLGHISLIDFDIAIENISSSDCDVIKERLMNIILNRQLKIKKS